MFNKLAAKIQVFFVTLSMRNLKAALAIMFLFVFVAAMPAYAFDPTQAMNKVLNFIALIIIAGGAVAAIGLFARSQIVPAIVVIIAAAVISVLINPSTMKSIGEGFSNLIGAGGTGSTT